MISIIIPTYNRAHLIKETLDSVLRQTYTQWECIVVDDGSDDYTERLIKTYIKLDSRFKFLKRPNSRPKGANACRNLGFENSLGEFINWLDSDDILHPDFLKLKINKLEKNKELDFCACINSTFKNDILKVVDIDRPAILNSNNYIEDYLVNGLYFLTSAPLWRKRFLMNKDLFDEALHRAQESEFHFRMLVSNVRYFYLDKILVYKRIEENSISSKSSTSIVAQLSIFRYFNKVFNYLKVYYRLEKKEDLMSYVFYRQTTNYYNINQVAKTFGERLNIFKSHSKFIINYLTSSKHLRKHFFKICLGFLFVLITNKGYKFFYFPEYNYAKK